MKPVIGILAHPSEKKMDPIGNPDNKIGQNYTESVHKAGGLPFIIPITDDEEMIQEYVNHIDGLLIPGGIDINPKYYHQDKHPSTNTPSQIFDSFEFHFLKQAEEKKLPILAICRGIQLLNIYHGGTLNQDIPNHKQKDPTRWAICHSVTFQEGSRLYTLFGDSLKVNSFHHQSLKEVPNFFYITAYSNDGVIEAIEAKDYPYMIGVQWHPEGFVYYDDSNMALFIDFVEECK